MYTFLFPKEQDKTNTVTIGSVNCLLKWNILKVSCRAKNRRTLMPSSPFKTKSTCNQKLATCGTSCRIDCWNNWNCLCTMLAD